jgi:cytoskeletal protein CcmA (bactofilin family)
VKCEGLEVSGKFEAIGLDCSGMMKISGSSYFEGDVKTEKADVSGSVKCEKAAEIAEATIMGSLSCENISGGNISVRGSIKSEKDIVVKNIFVRGLINCGGVLQADDIEIRFETGAKLTLGGMKGGNIVISPEYVPANITDRAEAGIITVNGTIEGEEIYLENVVADVVKGKKVTIGEGCKIGKIEEM